MSQVIVISDSEEEHAEILSPRSRLIRTQAVVTAGGAEPSTCHRRPAAADPRVRRQVVERAVRARIRNQLVERLRIQQAAHERQQRRAEQQRQREERRRLRKARAVDALRRGGPIAKPKARRRPKRRDRDLPTRCS